MLHQVARDKVVEVGGETKSKSGFIGPFPAKSQYSRIEGYARLHVFLFWGLSFHIGHRYHLGESVSTIYFFYFNFSFLLMFHEMPKSVTFDYAFNPKLKTAKLWDLFVTDPDGLAHTKPGWTKAVGAGTQFLGYLSWTEIGPDDPFLDSGHPLIQEAKSRGIAVLAKNPKWNSWIMDVANPDWHALFMELIDDAIGKGYAGIYWDTTDGFTEIPGLTREAELDFCQATEEMVASVRQKYTGAYQMVNRSWDMLPGMKDSIDHVLVESVWHSPNGAVDSQETEETIGLIEIAQDCAPVTILDYLPNGSLKQAKNIFRSAKSLGCGCTVVQGSLTDTVVLSPIPPRS
jgi:hypothetical protein